MNELHSYLFICVAVGSVGENSVIFLDACFVYSSKYYKSPPPPMISSSIVELPQVFTTVTIVLNEI